MLLHLRKGKDGYNIEVEEISDKRHTSNSNNNNNPSASSGKYVDLAVVPHERIPYIAEVRIGILLLLLSLHLLLGHIAIWKVVRWKARSMYISSRTSNFI